MTIDVKELSSKMLKAREVKAVELNGDLKPEVIQRYVRSITDHATKQSKTKRVVLVSFLF